MQAMVIDIGNTRTKVGIFQGTELMEVLIDPPLDTLPECVEEKEIDKVIVASVGHDPQQIGKALKTEYCIVLDHHTKVPVTNAYGSPQYTWYGPLAAVVGAQARFPQSNCLVIDAGTSITYDFIDAEANYHGGGISLGIDLRYRALNDHTQRLPLLSDKTHRR